MKNMMLRVKNFSLIALCAVLFLTACGKDDEPTSIVGNVGKPVWVAPDDYDITSSMNAIVKVDLSSIYTTSQLSAVNYHQTIDDIVAAFCEEECLGVAPMQDGLFYLFISAPKNGKNITIKHYSAALKHIYATRATIPYSNDGNLGTVSNPCTPAWKVEK